MHSNKQEFYVGIDRLQEGDLKNSRGFSEYVATPTQFL